MSEKKKPISIKVIFIGLGLVALAAGAYFGWRTEAGGQGPKIVLVGMDGMTWDLLGPMVESGKAPHFKALMDRGVHGDLKTLRSTYISAAIWNTILTGKVPKHHGIEGWFTTKGFPVNSTDRTTRYLPQMLSQGGITTASVGFMASWPAEQIDGWMVTDLASYGRFKDTSKAANQEVHDYTYLKKIDKVTWPPDLVDEILPVMLSPKDVPRSVYESVLPMDDAHWKDFQKIETVSRKKELSLLKFAVVTDYNFHRAGLEIIRRHSPMAYLVYFEGTDIIPHFFWKYMEPQYFKDEVTAEDAKLYGHCIENYYAFMDKLLGEIMDKSADDALIVVCSDHGMKRVDYWGQDGLHSGQHRVSKPPGIIIMAGPGVKKGVTIKDAVVFDIAPTILYLAGLPAGKDMDGKVLLDAVTPDFQKSHPLRFIETYDKGLGSKEEVYSPLNKEIRERLKALGYID